MDLYTSAHSIASHRVRIALLLKGLTYHSIVIVPESDGDGGQDGPEYRMLNPQGLLPTLTDREFSLSQSLAIIDYLDELQPEPPLLPRDRRRRARARQYAQILGCDVQPLLAPRVLRYLRTVLAVDAPALAAWQQHWLVEGFDALELWLTADLAVGPYCLGDELSLADVCLVPQFLAARRLGLPLDDFPTLAEVVENCERLPAFQRAAVT
ncbi:MAG: maleylacetoacetate isomerase [Gammaproteobacteria bacterium]|nr:maleylacetoacetate isomerase [Gammaproteobacteria bacterium]